MFILNFVPDISVPPIQIVQMNSFVEDLIIAGVGAFLGAFIPVLITLLWSKITNKREMKKQDDIRKKERNDANLERKKEFEARLNLERTFYLEKMQLNDLDKMANMAKETSISISNLYDDFFLKIKESKLESKSGEKKHLFTRKKSIENLSYFTSIGYDVQTFMEYYDFTQEEEMTITNWINNFSVFNNEIFLNIEEQDKKIINETFEKTLDLGSDVMMIALNKRIELYNKMNKS